MHPFIHANLVNYGSDDNVRRGFNLPAGDTAIRPRFLETLIGAPTKDVVFGGRLSEQIIGAARSSHDFGETKSPVRKPILVEAPLIVPVSVVVVSTTATTPANGNEHKSATVTPASAGVPVRSQTRAPFKFTVNGLTKKKADDGFVVAMIATHRNLKKVV